MDKEMIERCAKALWDYDQIERTKYNFSNSILFGMKGPISWDHITSEIVIPEVAQEYRAKALIIIKAMREPTQAQYDALCATNKVWRELDSLTVWQTYIDAVINE